MFRSEEITRDNGAVVQTWNLLVQEREPRPQQRQDQRDAPTRGQRTWDRTRERHTARDRAQAAGAALLEQAGRQAEPSDGRPFDDWPDDAERELMGEP
jgi:hypothetical protein